MDVINAVSISILVLGSVFLGTGWYFSFKRQRMIESALKDAVEKQNFSESSAEVLKERVAAKENEIEQLKIVSADNRNEIQALQKGKEMLQMQYSESQTTLQKERESHAEKMALLNEAKSRLEDAFKSLSSDALKQNNQSFIQLAQETLAKYQEHAKGDLEKRQQAIDQLVKPVHESLGKFDEKIRQIEKERVGAYNALTEQVKSLADTQGQLRSETSKLVDALKKPQVRGRWGEIQLRRVVEMAGMIEHCDFAEQVNVVSESGGSLRPDMIVKLPGGKQIVVDSKVPLEGYLKAIEAKDESSKEAFLREHARNVLSHVRQLSTKSYWEQFKPAPEFVVLFLPGEMFFSAALEQEPTLIEQGVEKKVIIATPTTLIALLKAVWYGWQQENLEKNAEAISELGKELYERVQIMSEHFSRVGKSLGSAVDAYNSTVASFESRVLVSTRKFKDLHVAPKKDVEIIEPVEKAPRALQTSDPNQSGND